MLEKLLTFRYRLLDKAGEGGTGGGSASSNGQSGQGAGSGNNGGTGSGSNGSSSGNNDGGSSDDPLFGDGGGDPGSSGGSGSGAGTGSANSGQQGGQGANRVVIPDNWKDALPDDLKNAAYMANVPTVETLVKNYANAQKMIGADKVPIPGQHASENDWKEAFHKLGNPRSLDEYKFELDPAHKEGADESFLNEFKKSAWGAGVLPRQAKALADWFNAFSKKSLEDASAKYEADLDSHVKKLKGEWGDSYDGNIARAKAALKEFATKDEMDYFRKSDLGRNPIFQRFLAKIGETLSEDKIKGGGSGSGGRRLTPSQADERIKEINSDPKHPYWNPNHENHKAAAKEMTALFEAKAAGSKK